MEGFLLKRGESGLRRWQKRYFVLDERSLSYYKDQKNYRAGESAKLTILIDQARVGMCTELDAKKFDRPNQRLCCVELTPDRTINKDVTKSLGAVESKISSLHSAASKKYGEVADRVAEKVQEVRKKEKEKKPVREIPRVFFLIAATPKEAKRWVVTMKEVANRPKKTKAFPEKSPTLPPPQEATAPRRTIPRRHANTTTTVFETMPPAFLSSKRKKEDPYILPNRLFDYFFVIEASTDDFVSRYDIDCDGENSVACVQSPAQSTMQSAAQSPIESPVSRPPPLPMSSPSTMTSPMDSPVSKPPPLPTSALALDTSAPQTNLPPAQPSPRSDISTPDNSPRGSVDEAPATPPPPLPSKDKKAVSAPSLAMHPTKPLQWLQADVDSDEDDGDEGEDDDEDYDDIFLLPPPPAPPAPSATQPAPCRKVLSIDPKAVLADLDEYIIPQRSLRVTSRYPLETIEGLELDPNWGTFAWPIPATELQLSATATRPRVHYNVLTSGTKKRTIKICAAFLTFSEAVNIKVGDTECVRYMPKALCVISHYPQFPLFRACLAHIFALERRGPIPLERWVSHLISEVPLPCAGFNTVRLLIAEHKLLLSLPSVFNPLISPFPMHLLFRVVRVTTVLEMFRTLVCEGRVLVHSASLSLLTIACQSLLQLLYPLEWTATYIPCLTEDSLGAVGVPSPFLLGAPSVFVPDLQAELDNVLLVNLDLDELKFVPSKWSPQPTPPLPRLPSEKLRDALWAQKVEMNRGQDGLSQNHQEWADLGNQHISPIDQGIFLAMLGFYQSLLSGFRKFVFRMKDGAQLNRAELGKTKTDVYNPEAAHFLTGFFESTMLAVFLDRDVEYDAEEHALLKLPFEFVAQHEETVAAKKALRQIKSCLAGEGLQVLVVPPLQAPVRDGDGKVESEEGEGKEEEEKNSVENGSAEEEEAEKTDNDDEKTDNDDEKEQVEKEEEEEEGVIHRAFVTPGDSKWTFDTDLFRPGSETRPAPLVLREDDDREMPPPRRFVAYRRVSLRQLRDQRDEAIMAIMTELFNSNKQPPTEKRFKQLLEGCLDRYHVVTTIVRNSMTTKAFSGIGLCLGPHSFVILMHVFRFILFVIASHPSWERGTKKKDEEGQEGDEEEDEEQQQAETDADIKVLIQHVATIYHASQFYHCLDLGKLDLTEGTSGVRRTLIQRTPERGTRSGTHPNGARVRSSMNQMFAGHHPFRAKDRKTRLLWLGSITEVVQELQANMQAEAEARATGSRPASPVANGRSVDDGTGGGQAVSYNVKQFHEKVYKLLQRFLTRMTDLNVTLSTAKHCITHTCDRFGLPPRIKEEMLSIAKQFFEHAQQRHEKTPTPRLLPPGSFWLEAMGAPEHYLTQRQRESFTMFLSGWLDVVVIQGGAGARKKKTRCTDAWVILSEHELWWLDAPGPQGRLLGRVPLKGIQPTKKVLPSERDQKDKAFSLGISIRERVRVELSYSAQNSKLGCGTGKEWKTLVMGQWLRWLRIARMLLRSPAHVPHKFADKLARVAEKRELERRNEAYNALVDAEK